MVKRASFPAPEAESDNPVRLDTLAGARRWVAWRTERVDGKPRKIPIDPNTGRRAKIPTDPKTYSTHEDAERRWNKSTMADPEALVLSSEILAASV
jgi:hypothetical protein